MSISIELLSIVDYITEKALQVANLAEENAEWIMVPKRYLFQKSETQRC